MYCDITIDDQTQCLIDMKIAEITQIVSEMSNTDNYLDITSQKIFELWEASIFRWWGFQCPNIFSSLQENDRILILIEFVLTKAIELKLIS